MTKKLTINSKETGNVEASLRKSCRILKERRRSVEKIRERDLKAICGQAAAVFAVFYFLLDFFSMKILEVKSVSAEDPTDTQTAYTVTVDSSDPPFMTSTRHSEFTAVDESENVNPEDIDPTEIPTSDITTILMCAAPAILVVLLIPLTIFMVRRKRRKKHKEGSVGPSNEDAKSPIFEEDTPSVMEIEMEDLDKWMSNMKKNSCHLSTLEEENKLAIRLHEFHFHQDADNVFIATE
ncbi:transmembrane protein 154 [Gastrophryne carolinensis]